MRLVALMPVWRRLDLATLVMHRWLVLRNEIARAGLPIDLRMVVVGSEGPASQQWAESFSVHRYVDSPNAPLGRKFNDGLAAAKAFEPDAVVRAESDDLFTLDVMKLYLREWEQAECVGFHDFYYLRPPGAFSYHWGHPSMIAGAGMLLRADFLNRTGWRPFDETIPHPYRNLDLELQKRFQSTRVLCLRDEGALLVDVKTAENLTPYAQLQAVAADPALLDRFPQPEREEILRLLAHSQPIDAPPPRPRHVALPNRAPSRGTKRTKVAFTAPPKGRLTPRRPIR